MARQKVSPPSLLPPLKAATTKRIKAAARPEPGDDRYIVIRDTREKSGQGWSFAASSSCGGTRISTMKTGDYTLEGFENLVCVERKGSIAEFAGNLGQPRFRKELDRMASFKHCVVVLEFNMDDIMMWPQGSGIPKSRQQYMRINKHYILKKFWELQRDYPHISFLFVGRHGKDVVSSLFKRIVESYGNERLKREN
jgi:ERCC4-type nuclease